MRVLDDSQEVFAKDGVHGRKRRASLHVMIRAHAHECHFLSAGSHEHQQLQTPSPQTPSSVDLQYDVLLNNYMILLQHSRFVSS